MLFAYERRLRAICGHSAHPALWNAIFGSVDRSAVRRLDRHQFQPFRISGFATKSERSLPPDPGSFNQLPTDSEDTRVRYVSRRSF
jgi:hypothetical protein